MMMDRKEHVVIVGDHWRERALEDALVRHAPAYCADSKQRTRLTVVGISMEEVYDFLFDYQELFDNSYYRIVNLTAEPPKVELNTPCYAGVRQDFVDVEWEFVIGGLSNPVVQRKLRLWDGDASQHLTIALCHSDRAENQRFVGRLRRRLSVGVDIVVFNPDSQEQERRREQWLEMARYLHYFYKVSYERGEVPTELPEDEVNLEWDKLNDLMRNSNIYNVMAIPFKMELLGHKPDDWSTFYALTASEIEQLTEIEHNRWVVERLIQGSRPCTDQERSEIAEDMRRRLADSDYARLNPVSLKKKYKTERNAHYDLCAYCELGVDETGLPVTRYDRDLTAAIPLIVKSFNDRSNHG